MIDAELAPLTITQANTNQQEAWDRLVCFVATGYDATVLTRELCPVTMICASQPEEIQ